MRIKVDEQTLDRLFSVGPTLFVVPDYQRPYSWGVDQLNDFWDDIDQLPDDEEHFMGSIVFIVDSHNPSNFNKLEVVDGQQRLTTISILLKVLQDKYIELGDEQAADSIKDLLYSRIIQQEPRIKLCLGRIDRDNYRKFIKGEYEEIKSTSIYKAYNFFKEKLKEINSVEEITKLLHKIVYKINFVIISTDSARSAYRLFETLNDRGLELSSVDLIKNHLLKVVSEKGLNLDYVKDAWEEIINNLNGIDKVRYFRQYLMSSKIYKIKGKITQEGLYDKFCSILHSIKDIEGYVDDIRKQSVLYNKIANFAIDNFDNSKNEVINRHLRYIAAIKATTSYTFLLRVFNELKSAEEIIKILEVIEVFAIRRSIVGVSTADIDIIYNNLAHKAFDGDSCYDFVVNILKKNIPSDSEFEDKFKKAQLRQNDQTKYILDRIEVIGYGSGQEGRLVANSFHVHIEHIAPQSMKNPKNWPGFEKLDETERREYIMNVGNLTLLEKRPNIQAANSSFKEKKQFYTRENTDILMTHDLLKYDQWGVREIEERAKELAKKAVEIWKF